MSGVVIHLPAEAGTDGTGGTGGADRGDRGIGAGVTMRLEPGEVVRFGRGSASMPVELRLSDPAVSRLAGEIRVTQDHWQLTNHSPTQSYLVENPEGAGEYLRVPPRRAAAPIPFEFARVVLPGRDQAVGFQVFAPGHLYLDRPGVDGPWGSRTLTAYSLDESAAYFLVLVALCEPRLRDESAIAVPTTPQVVERLCNHPEFGQLTARAISSHIDYLAGDKLRLAEPSDPGRGSRRNGKREALVALALRFGLVGEEHLALLPPRSRGGAPVLSGAR